MRTIHGGVVVLLIGMAMPEARAYAAEAPADVIVTGGTILTLDPARPRAGAVAIRGGRFVAVGDLASVQSLVGPSTRRIDLRGAVAVPGLGDAHAHVEGLGESLESIDLVDAATLEETLGRVRRGASTLGKEEWVLGRGWDQNDWPGKQFPTAKDLDAATAGRPAALRRIDGHASWVSSRALEIAGITAATPDPSGGRILRDAAGQPTGVLVDTAQQLVGAKVPLATRAVRKRRLARGLQAAAEGGLTAVHDAGVDLVGVELYKELVAEGRLPVRAYVMLRMAEFLAHPELRPEIGLGDGLLTVRSIKVVADGALGSRGALLLEPYADEPGTKGLLTVDTGAFRDLLKKAMARGFQVNTHAIGDAANRMVLDAYAVEHAQVVSPADIPRFKTLGVIPSVQPTHCTSDMYWATDRLGEGRARGAYLWRTFREAGLALPAGSDAPVERIAVVPGLHAAVTRQDAKGWPEGGWHPEERVSAEDALRMFSEDVAYAAFEEAERGRIMTGRRADLTVLTQDVTAVAPRAILDTRVAMTMVGGRVVHEAAPAKD